MTKNVNINASKALLILAFALAFVATVLGFAWYHTDGDPRVLGWVAASLTSYFASLLV